MDLTIRFIKQHQWFTEKWGIIQFRHYFELLARHMEYYQDHIFSSFLVQVMILGRLDDCCLNWLNCWYLNFVFDWICVAWFLFPCVSSKLISAFQSKPVSFSLLVLAFSDQILTLRSYQFKLNSKSWWFVGYGWPLTFRNWWH